MPMLRAILRTSSAAHAYRAPPHRFYCECPHWRKEYANHWTKIPRIARHCCYPGDFEQVQDGRRNLTFGFRPLLPGQRRLSMS